MNTYLIYSKSYYEKEEYVSTIVGESLNIVRYNLEETSLQDIIDEASYMSFFEDLKYIVISNSNIFNKDDKKSSELLIKYLSDPNPNVVLIFTTNKELKNEKLVKLIKNVKACEELTESSLTSKINKKFKDKKIKISSKSVSYIINACIRDYDLIRNELEKIFLYCLDKEEVTDEEVKDIISEYLDQVNFKFGDAIISKNIPLALKYLEQLELEKTDEQKLMGLVASKYRDMYYTMILRNEGKSIDEIASILKAKPYPIKLAGQNALKYHENEIIDILKLLEELDYKIKKYYMNGYNALRLFIINL